MDFSNNKSWPFLEAQKILKRVQARPDDRADDPVVFMTGFSPSGRIHIGSVAEVVRTAMVRNAFVRLTSGMSDKKYETRLIVFSDDYDGMRKTDDPLLEMHMGQPLSEIYPGGPDGNNEVSLADVNNGFMKSYLYEFPIVSGNYGSNYEFVSASEMYKSGAFNDMLRTVYNRYETIMGIMLPTLGPERGATYSPFVVKHPDTGIMLDDVIVSRIRILNNGDINDINEYGLRVTSLDGSFKPFETDIFDGNVKLQWKIDWPARWIHYGTTWESFGKDHVQNFGVSSEICRVLGGEPPIGYQYELFLDEEAHKISKTSGNGIRLDDWLKSAPSESVAYWLYHKPKSAKKLFTNTIVENTDRWLRDHEKFKELSTRDGGGSGSDSDCERADHALWHVHNGNPSIRHESYVESITGKGLSFALLVNLAGCLNTRDGIDPEAFASYAKDYAVRHANANQEIGESGEYTREIIDRIFNDDNDLFVKLLEGAIHYYQTYVAGEVELRAPDDYEVGMLTVLMDRLGTILDAESTPAEIQQVACDVAHEFPDRYVTDGKIVRDYWKVLYQVLLGQDSGPRFGQFAAMYGISNTCNLIRERISGS